MKRRHLLRLRMWTHGRKRRLGAYSNLAGENNALNSSLCDGLNGSDDWSRECRCPVGRAASVIARAEGWIAGADHIPLFVPSCRDPHASSRGSGT